MKDLAKKYLFPYAIIIFAVYLITPIFFIGEDKKAFTPILYYFIFLITQVGCSAVFSAKKGMDFLFALIAPVAFLISMFIYNGGFANFSNIILLIVYLVAGIFGLFLGDLAFGDERHKREKQEQKEAEEVLLRANRRDERERERMERRSAQRTERTVRERPAKKSEPVRSAEPEAASYTAQNIDDDDFDYDKYMSDIDKLLEDDKY